MGVANDSFQHQYLCFATEQHNGFMYSPHKFTLCPLLTSLTFVISYKISTTPTCFLVIALTFSQIYYILAVNRQYILISSILLARSTYFQSISFVIFTSFPYVTDGRRQFSYLAHTSKFFNSFVLLEFSITSERGKLALTRKHC